jgi:hypothetical protein
VCFRGVEVTASRPVGDGGKPHQCSILLCLRESPLGCHRRFLCPAIVTIRLDSLPQPILFAAGLLTLQLKHGWMTGVGSSGRARHELENQENGHPDESERG